MTAARELAKAAKAIRPDTLPSVPFTPTDGTETTVQVALDKASKSLQPAYNYVSRGGNYLGIGQQADFDGFGKGGLLLGGGDAGRGTGTYITCDGLRNWVAVQSGKAFNPTELIIYGSSGQGYAYTVPGTNQITRDYGTGFDASWVGKTLYFLRKKFKVVAVASTSSLTLSEMNGASITFASPAELEAFNFCYTTGDGICNIVGDRVKWVSGDPFVPLFFRDFHLLLNGVERSVAEFISAKEWRLSSAPGDASNIPFSWYGDINDQLSTFRVQAIQGGREENVNLLAIAGHPFFERHYALVAGGTGANGAVARPLHIGSGSYSSYNNRYTIGAYPEGGPGGSYGSGYVALGGVQGLEALRVLASADMSTQRNRLEIPATISGFNPAIRAKGVDADIGVGLDAKGIGGFSVTQDFARSIFRAVGPASSVNYLEVAASVVGSPVQINAKGADTSVDLRLTPKGSGVLRFGVLSATGDVAITGYITIKDDTGTLRKLAVIN